MGRVRVERHQEQVLACGTAGWCSERPFDTVLSVLWHSTRFIMHIILLGPCSPEACNRKDRSMMRGITAALLHCSLVRRVDLAQAEEYSKCALLHKQVAGV